VYPFFPKEQMQYLLAAFGAWTAAGEFNLPEENTLNNRFPDIKPVSLKQVLEQGWKE
jgi:hypothetical protein